MHSTPQKSLFYARMQLHRNNNHIYQLQRVVAYYEYLSSNTTLRGGVSLEAKPTRSFSFLTEVWFLINVCIMALPSLCCWCSMHCGTFWMQGLWQIKSMIELGSGPWIGNCQGHGARLWIQLEVHCGKLWRQHASNINFYLLTLYTLPALSHSVY